MSTTSIALNRVENPRFAGLRKWALMPVVLAGIAMVVLDFFIVNVAMPATQSDLHAGAGAIQWVVAGYGLALAAGLITGGRLGDMFGRRRIFAVGLALFTLTSAAAGAAPTAEFLIAARVGQGLASALLMPQVLAIIGVAYDGEDRVKAITAYALTMGLAAVAGQLIGGVLIQLNIAGLDWRSCFLVNVPVGLAALAMVPRLVPETKAQRTGRLDLVGADLVTAGLVAIILPLIDGRQYGWPAWTWISMAAAPVLLAAFGLYQRRLAGRGGSPLVAPALFRERAFRVGLGMLVVFYASVASFFLVLALYLQNGRGLSALDSGLVFSFEGIGFLATSMAGPAITKRLGVQGLAVGAAIRAVALLGFWIAIGQIGTGGSVVWVALSLLIDGAGMGMVMGPSTQMVLAKVSPEHAGAAAGVLATAQQVGNAIGVAVIGVVFFGALHVGVAHAFRLGLIGLVGLSVATVALVQRLR
jgi:EmrB/QacA subfamily drug resistance transporter